MKKSVLVGALLMLAAQVALAQAPTPPDTSATPTQTQPPAVAPPVTPPPAAPPAAPPPSQPTPMRTTPTASRYGSISGSYLRPMSDFDTVAKDGWAITLEGFQFITPTRKIAIGSQVGYQSFGEKNGISVSNFPVDAILKFFPKPGTGKADVYVTGGLGFNYMRTDYGFTTNSDYFFGTQAGVGVELHTNGPASLVVDAVYHWVFADLTDANFVAFRGGLVIPMSR